MYTNEQKKEMVEYGIKKFNLDHEFLNWLIDEFNIIYQKILEERIELDEEFKEILKQRV
jgi:hypothetical protein